VASTAQNGIRQIAPPASGAPTGLFNDWVLRKALADLDGIAPQFLQDEECGTILPLGLDGDTIVFYGGRFYNERNGFIGPAGGEQRLLAWLAGSSRPFRLLGWDRDPIRFLDSGHVLWDVPYNQNWALDPPPSFDAYQAGFSESRQRNNRYLVRRYVDTGCVAAEFPDMGDLWSLIETFMGHTAEGFAARGKHSIYEDAGYRRVARILIGYLAERDMLRVFELRNDDTLVGLCVAAETPGELVYLLNLYRRQPSRISNAGLLAMIRYCVGHKLRLDGLRGAFGLKSDYGMKPEPRYALVRDPKWKIRMPTDLSEEATVALYGRRFGAAA
jgi:hypothetical protein